MRLTNSDSQETAFMFGRIPVLNVFAARPYGWSHCNDSMLPQQASLIIRLVLWGKSRFVLVRSSKTRLHWSHSKVSFVAHASAWTQRSSLPLATESHGRILKCHNDLLQVKKFLPCSHRIESLIRSVSIRLPLYSITKMLRKAAACHRASVGHFISASELLRAASGEYTQVALKEAAIRMEKNETQL